MDDRVARTKRSAVAAWARSRTRCRCARICEARPYLDLLWRHVADAECRCSVLYQAKKVVADAVGMLAAAEADWEVGAVLDGLELRLSENGLSSETCGRELRLLVMSRSTSRAATRLGAHGGAAVGVEASGCRARRRGCA